MQTTKKQMLREMLEMATEAVDDTLARGEEVAEWQLVNVQRIQAELDALGGSVGETINVPDSSGLGKRLALTARREAGSVAKNQYGTFQVHYATEKQTRFLGSLLDRKDLTKLTTGPLAVDIDTLRQQVRDLKVNKRAASDILDRLIPLPDRVSTPDRPVQVRPASDKQIAFLLSLAAERTPDVDREAVKAWAGREGSKAVSDKINELLAMPKPVVASKIVEAGVYTNDSETYRVYLGQNSGRMLAALVVEHSDGTAEFEYQGQADRYVTSAFRKLTIEEAARFGKATGTCIVCARRLDVPESVDRGIGPVCFAKMQ